MSFQVGTACYSSAGAAAAAVASTQTGQVVPSGSVVYVIDAEADGSGSITYTLSDVTGVQPAVIYQQAPTLAPCGLLTAADATVMGWGVAAAWLAAYAILAMRRAM